MSKLRFNDLAGISFQYGFNFERENSPTGKYVLFNNEHALGTEGIYQTLEEAWQDISQLQVGTNPLTGEPLNGFIESSN